jgi:site-specific recombinase XerD
VDITAAQAEWRFACEARDYSPNALRWNDHKVRRFTRWCAEQGVTQIEDVTAGHVNRFIVSLPKDLTDHTRKGYAQSVKAFLNWCAREDLISEKIPKRVSMPRVTEKVIQTFTPGQIRRLLAACDQEPYGWMRARDWAIILVLLDTGLRASELCGLTLRDVHFGQDSHLQVMGKGRRERQVGLGEQSRAEASPLHLPPPERARGPTAGVHRAEGRATRSEWAAPACRSPTRLGRARTLSGYPR